ncbi:MAG: TetR/AcrR family transcriptional regulator [Actinobacteria bacterium]|nr:TetR/AcrR family transcriptional regulator [Actinomycetota bacterium]
MGGIIKKKKTKKRTRLSPELRREQLVEIGAQLFAERPFSDVWIEQVADAAGVSRGLVYHYFPNKRDFYAAVVRHGAQDTLRITAPDPELPPLQRLRDSLDHFLEYVEQRENVFRAIHRGQHSSDEAVRAAVRESRDEQAERIIAHLGPPVESTPTLMLALEGWMHFNESVVLDWLETREIGRDVVLDLMTGSLVGILISAMRADGTAELPEMLEELQLQLQQASATV